MARAQRYGIQLPRAHGTITQNGTDLAREAVSCNGVLERTSLSTAITIRLTALQPDKPIGSALYSP